VLRSSWVCSTSCGCASSAEQMQGGYNTHPWLFVLSLCLLCLYKLPLACLFAADLMLLVLTCTAAVGTCVLATSMPEVTPVRLPCVLCHRGT
jgi:hypothetical protein